MTQARADLFNICNHSNVGTQLYELSYIQAIHPDAEQLPRLRRPERRPQSAVSNWRAARSVQLALKLQS